MFRCVKCERSFVQKSSLSRHQRESCRVINNPQTENSGQYDASIVNKLAAKRMKTSDDGASTSSAVKTFPCGNCVRSFTRKSNLIRHQRRPCVAINNFQTAKRARDNDDDASTDINGDISMDAKRVAQSQPITDGVKNKKKSSILQYNLSEDSISEDESCSSNYNLRPNKSTYSDNDDGEYMDSQDDNSQGDPVNTHLANYTLSSPKYDKLFRVRKNKSSGGYYIAEETTGEDESCDSNYNFTPNKSAYSDNDDGEYIDSQDDNSQGGPVNTHLANYTLSSPKYDKLFRVRKNKSSGRYYIAEESTGEDESCDSNYNFTPNKSAYSDNDDGEYMDSQDDGEVDWKNVHVLIARLQLLWNSKMAGNMNHEDEIIYIIEQLRNEDLLEKTHLAPGNFEIEYVEPLRIVAASDEHLPLDKMVLRHHNEHFRHRLTETWDEHPHYEIDAFGKHFYLELEHNSKFVSPGLHIVSHFPNNITQKTKHDRRMSGCFYSGRVRGDDDSSVTVSLCGGMTGYIRTSENSYYIEPAEIYTNRTTGSIMHRMQKLHYPTKEEELASSESTEFFEENGNHTVIIDDHYDYLADHTVRRKRSASNEDQSESTQADGGCQTISETEWKNSEELTRTTRNVESGSVYRIKESFVKVLVVADKSMVKFHTHLSDYILTLMSHVAMLFKHESIGNAITVTVPMIAIRYEDFKKDMLQSFCNWQKSKYRDRDHDVAILLTRNSICRDESGSRNCTTIGIAQVKSMCQWGCAIVKDKGLASSYTIAHELGHVLGMLHDEDEKCKELNKNKKITNIMGQAIKKDTKPFSWSPCSRYFLNKFLNSYDAHCLRHPPRKNYINYTYSETLPGDKFNINSQCELYFGPGYQVCLNMKPCEHLYCKKNDSDTCHSEYSPWADGTKCGESSICFNGECRLEEEIIQIDGGWGSWQDWEPCTRTCGGGIRKSERHCDSPTPMNGGSYCLGESVRYESCNTMDCPPGTIDFRVEQCAEFNNATTVWYPDYPLDNPESLCILYCRPNNTKPRENKKGKVIDGTKCGKTGFGICVNGICKPGGCDNKLDSSATLDECGICGGDNSQCQEIIGTYNKPAETSGYSSVVRIPKGSSNLNITQDAYPYLEDENYLALIDGETGQALLNGDNMAKSYGTTILFGNLEITYSGSGTSLEWLRSPKNKKLSKDLILGVLSVGKLTPPNIQYRYLIEKEKAPVYGWRLYQKQWTKCNSICEGKQFRKPICVDLVSGTEVSKNYCLNLEGMPTQKQECNTHCQLTWNIDSRSSCTPSCGKGERRIYYSCMKVYKKKPIYSEVINEKYCSNLTPPPMMEPCETVCNTTRWHYSQWSACSNSCGGGTQKRTAKCIDESNTHIDDIYCNSSELLTEQVCNTQSCPVWKLAETSTCSASCGGGYKNFTYHCIMDNRVMDDACESITRPPERESCNEQPCGRWAPTNFYHQCSVTCGEGIERKKYVCKKFDSEEILDDEYCRDQTMPNESRVCYPSDCVVISPPLHDENDNHIFAAPYDYNPFRWLPSDWSQCSKSCQGGVMHQIFRCLNHKSFEDETMCNPNLRPVVKKPCNNHPCPRWKTGSWSPSCNINCERQRQVKCLDHTNALVHDSLCIALKKPDNTVKCKLSECPNAKVIPRTYFVKENDDRRYRWKVGPWKKCSNNCGKGTRRRHVECEDSLNEITVVDQFCANKKKPKMTKPCEKYACNYAWMESYWSPCSASCGNGMKTRNVSCHRVHHGGIIDPVPLPELYQNKIHHQDYCSVYKKPPTTAKCLISYCGDEYMWQPEPWKECSHKCGRKGRQTRILNCVSVRNRERVPRYMCRKSLKPPRRRKCNQFKCLQKSCREIKNFMKTKENRDYVISVRGRPVLIYCYKMDTPYPQEYISLHPDKLNYAEIYDKRLIDVRTCPFNGQREDRCDCVDVGPDRSGFTKFWKVRVNITSMQIMGDDFTFSKQLKGRQIPYGTAGDCYSSLRGCAQGTFSVDLTHTSFKLAKSVKWEELGSYASASIHKSDTMAYGRCGGYCGDCIPDPSIGLAVEIT